MYRDIVTNEKRINRRYLDAIWTIVADRGVLYIPAHESAFCSSVLHWESGLEYGRKKFPFPMVEQVGYTKVLPLEGLLFGL